MEKLKQESSLIENEQWEFIEVPSDFQNIANRLISQGTAKEFTNGTHEPANGDSSDTRDSSKFLVINGQSYWMVGCSLLLIKTIEEYVQCVSNLQSIGADVMHKLIEMLKVRYAGCAEGN
jgi:vacuolar protein sorting-associated protein 54